MDRAAILAALDSADGTTPVNDDGRSGAVIARVPLADGTTVVVKRFDPALDLVMRMTGDDRGREVALAKSGLLERLPPTVAHSFLDAWYDDDGHGVLVMRDLGDTVLGWSSVVTPDQARTLFTGLRDLHAAYAGTHPEGLAPLPSVLSMFEPARLAPHAGEGLVQYALRGWEYWPEVATGEVAERVLELALDTAPLAAACADRPATLLHGDLATVNAAFEPDRPGCLTLIDWGMATVGPAEVDLGRLLAGCGHLFGSLGMDDLVALHRDLAGAAYDEDGMRLGLLAGLTWLGWNKALDVVEHPRPEVRERERAALGWWLRQAGLALDAGVV